MLFLLLIFYPGGHHSWRNLTFYPGGHHFFSKILRQLSAVDVSWLVLLCFVSFVAIPAAHFLPGRASLLKEFDVLPGRASFLFKNFTSAFSRRWILTCFALFRFSDNLNVSLNWNLPRSTNTGYRLTVFKSADLLAGRLFFNVSIFQLQRFNASQFLVTMTTYSEDPLFTSINQ